MKKLLLSIVTISTLNISVTAQNVNIPDASFKAYLLGNAAINTDADPTEISVAEAAAYTGGIDCSYQGVGNITGIEAFTNITSFHFIENYLTTLDLSQNTALTNISCYYSYILTSLILGPNTVLTNLDLSYSPSIVNLNLSANTGLVTVALDICSSLTNLDVSQNTALKYLYVSDCNLSTIDVSNNTLLEKFRCEGNNLSSLDVTKNTALKRLTCFENNISILDVSRNTAMTNFQCNDNALTILNMKNLSTTTLPQINADDNPNLTCIDVDDVAASTSTWVYVDAGVNFSLNCQVDLVNSINVEGQGGETVISVPAGTLQMIANVFPTYADDYSCTWSVTNGTGSATIDANGLLTAETDGTVTVVATANDGTGVSGTKQIFIFNQTASVKENEIAELVEVYPNPVQTELFINSKENIESIEIRNSLGQIVKKITSNNNSIDVSDLKQGVYFLQIETGKGLVSKRFIKK